MKAALRRWAGRLMLALPAALLVCSGTTSAATPEVEVKAAYLYKLASFVRWPAGAGGGSFKFCIAGRDDVAGVLQQLVRGQQVDGRALSVAQVTASQADQAKGCQVLYLGRGPETAHALLAATRGLPVLTVGDRNGGTNGGVVDFVISNGHVRLAIDRGDAASRHLELSSKLLDVAVAVDR
jgi:hypothetical protein